MDNLAISRKLMEQSHNGACRRNLYRARAYRRAAAVISGLDRPVGALIAEKGPDGVRALPGIGRSLARTIAEMVCPNCSAGSE